MYQRILFAVDGSYASYPALYQAIVVNKVTGAEVETLFVVDSSDITFDMVGSDSIAYAKRVAGYGHDTLAEVPKKLGVAGVKHLTKLLENSIAPGQISVTIVAEVNETAADLIVLGTHGRRGLKHLVLGSVAEGVIRKTNKSVLTVCSEVEEQRAPIECCPCVCVRGHSAAIPCTMIRVIRSAGWMRPLNR